MTIMIRRHVFASSLVLLIVPLIGGTGLSSMISVGGTSIDIPIPEGFAELTPEMETLYKLQQQANYPGNRRYVTYIPESLVPKALGDASPVLQRWFDVQGVANAATLTISNSMFQHLKQSFRTRIEETFTDLEKKAPRLVEDWNKGLRKELGVEFALSDMRMIPLPPHYEIDQAFAYSQFMKMERRSESGTATPLIFSATSNLIHVKDKTLFLYCYGREEDLEWTRAASKQWVESILGANVSAAGIAPEEPIPHSVTGVDWDRLMAKGVAGAVSGLILGGIGVVVWLIRHRRESFEEKDSENSQGGQNKE